MQRTRAWRRAQFEKKRKRELRYVNAVTKPYAQETWEHQLEENKESLRKGGLKRVWFVRYWRDDPWFHWLQEDKRKKKDRPLDKEIEAWYDEG